MFDNKPSLRYTPRNGVSFGFAAIKHVRTVVKLVDPVPVGSSTSACVLNAWLVGRIAIVVIFSRILRSAVSNIVGRLNYNNAP